MMILILSNVYYGLAIIDSISFIKIRGRMFIFLVPLFRGKS